MKPLLFAASLGIFSVPAFSALVVTSENFDGKGTVPGTGGNANHMFQVTDWTESNATDGSYLDFGLISGNGAYVGGGQTNDANSLTPGLSGAGYFYQIIGTRGALTSANSLLNVTGVNFKRNNGQHAGLVISLYRAPNATVNQADGTAISSVAGATLVGSFTNTSSYTAANGAAPSFNYNFDLSSVADDDQLILHFRSTGANNGSGGVIAYTDTLNMALVPEPSAALLGGFGLLTLLRRRCR